MKHEHTGRRVRVDRFVQGRKIDIATAQVAHQHDEMIQ